MRWTRLTAFAALPGVLAWTTALAQTGEHGGRPFAAPGSASAPAAGVTGLGEVTFALIIVLAAIFAAAWILRRMRGLTGRVGSAIEILADLPLGQRERAVLVRVGATQLLLGVAPGRLTTLHVLAEPIEIPGATAQDGEARPTFKSLLLRSLGRS